MKLLRLLYTALVVLLAPAAAYCAVIEWTTASYMRTIDHVLYALALFISALYAATSIALCFFARHLIRTARENSSKRAP